MCGVAQFHSYDEAAEHESTCNQKPFSSNPALKSSPREVEAEGAEGGAEEEPRPANKKPAAIGVSPGDSDKKRKAKGALPKKASKFAKTKTVRPPTTDPRASNEEEDTPKSALTEDSHGSSADTDYDADGEHEGVVHVEDEAKDVEEVGVGAVAKVGTTLVAAAEPGIKKKKKKKSGRKSCGKKRALVDTNAKASLSARM